MAAGARPHAKKEKHLWRGKSGRKATWEGRDKKKAFRGEGREKSGSERGAKMGGGLKTAAQVPKKWAE